MSAWKCGLLPAHTMSPAEHSAQDTGTHGWILRTFGELQRLKCEAMTKRLDTDCVFKHRFNLH